MYKYDTYDQSIVDARVAEFRDQVNRRLAGEITEDQFKPLRLMNGLYLQLHAYMLRVAVPYGTMDSKQMHMLAHIARKYDRGYGHFTTRQNIQYNWIKLEECADLLEELASVEMHAIQTSGNCIRNISSDQYAGASADEVADPRPWAELLRQWSTFHPEFSYLPRKFKIAVIASPEDRAAMRLHDIGIELVKNDGVLGGRVFVGGGMGRTPMIAPEINPFVRAEDLLSYIEACLRVYNRYGRRDNIYKARIKILVHEIGADSYRDQVAEEFAHVKTLGIDPPMAEFDRIAAFFAAPEPIQEELRHSREGGNLSANLSVETIVQELDPRLRGGDGVEEFKIWVRQNVKPHKASSYAIVNISLKPIGGIPGDATADQIDVMAKLAKDYSFDELRVTHAQNIVLPHVAKRDLYALWSALREAELADANLDLISDIIACPGLDYCSLANARSIPVAQKIATRFADMDRQRDLGELKLKISGCINACGHHHAGHIGILGVDRKGVENYQLTFGGSGAEDVSIGKIIGPGFDEDGVVDAVEKATEVYKNLRTGDERFIDTYRRVGLDPFKEAIYG
jgi:sulfite reductase (NADPH) hemoprotein beta-component